MSKFPEGFEPARSLYVGAEAEIWLGRWMDMVVVAQIRRSKGYRPKQLDERMIESRTIREANLIHEAKSAGIPTPFIYHVNPVTGAIIMSYIYGTPLKELLMSKHEPVLKRAGIMAGRLHEAHISHGDLTPSNMIVRDGEVVLLDFGLGEKTSELEKFAEDLNVMKRSLDSSFGEHSSTYWNEFEEGYVECGGDFAKSVLERLDEVWARGRYKRRRADD